MAQIAVDFYAHDLGGEGRSVHRRSSPPSTDHPATFGIGSPLSGGGDAFRATPWESAETIDDHQREI
ncbi:hypothetical protein L0U85_18470 [Glycomyces sp. L485]|uniref:hypothetical protein n=1 Tax=Glycomyces sp. L485 TaxID=2909235 RepID=UPI001F4B30B8|nr:hypothetical protein [Glycomyces sp. L485]MCH7232822.1 hypothetical protein [Glycomyces sp. L485]